MWAWWRTAREGGRQDEGTDEIRVAVTGRKRTTPDETSPSEGPSFGAVRSSWLAWCVTHTAEGASGSQSQCSAGPLDPQWDESGAPAGAQEACTRGTPHAIPNATASRAAASRYVGDRFVTVPFGLVKSVDGMGGRGIRSGGGPGDWSLYQDGHTRPEMEASRENGF